MCGLAPAATMPDSLCCVVLLFFFLYMCCAAWVHQELLLGLAAKAGLGDKIKAMASGVHINLTEDRWVATARRLHPTLCC